MNKTILRITSLFIAITLTLGMFRLGQAQSLTATSVKIYGDSLDSNWQDWSWNATRNFANSSPVHSGTKSISVKITAAWGALYLHRSSPQSTAGYTQLNFYINGGSSGGQRLSVVANGNTANVYTFTVPANTWTKVAISLTKFGSPSSLSDLYFQDAAGKAQPIFYLDSITLEGSVSTPTAANVHTATPVVILSGPTATAVQNATPVVIAPSPTATVTKTPAITPTTTSGKAWYVDNSVSASGDGSSWEKSWKSFSLINWSVINPGDTIYISGGSNSQTYYETLTINKGGSNGKYINIDVGANSPFPSGHSGTVILDGGGTLRDNIYSYGYSYIRINGYDSARNYKMQLQNSRFAAEGDAAILIRNGDNLIVDYVKIEMGTNRGIFMYNTNHSRIRGCDIRTGEVNNTIQTDNIYVGYSYDTDIENNVLYNNNAIVTESHNDPIQCGNCGRVNIRNNFISTTYDADALITGNATDWIHIYNNVLISNIRQKWAATVLLKGDGGATGVQYFWNNTVVQSNDNQGYVLELYQIPDAFVGAIKNNIFYGNNVPAIGSDYAITPGKIDNNCLYRTTGTIISYLGGTERTWAQHQAAGYDVHGISAAPQFINNFADLHLQSNSPCRNIGADLSTYFTTDISGVIRPIGTWDTGAYQYQP